MRAWSLDGAFGLENLHLIDLPEPEPAPGELLLGLRAASLNYRDLLILTGRYNPKQPLPLIPGSDACAEVLAVGAGVRGVSVGDRVLPSFSQTWLAGPLRGAAQRGALGGPLSGVLRARFCLPAAACVRAPAHLTDAEAATLPCAGVTAWRALAVEGRVRPGDVVLTQGTGGVSLFAVQLGALLGARVIVTSSQDARLERALALGATHGLNYRAAPDWGAKAAALAGGEGVDLVVELGGAGTLDQSLRAVRPGGTVAVIGVLDGVEVPLQLTRLLMRGVRLQGVFVGSRDDLADLCRALEAAPAVRPVVDRVFPFDALPAALAHLQAGAHMGKVVVAAPEARDR